MIDPAKIVNERQIVSLDDLKGETIDRVYDQSYDGQLIIIFKSEKFGIFHGRGGYDGCGEIDLDSKLDPREYYLLCNSGIVSGEDYNEWNENRERTQADINAREEEIKEIEMLSYLKRKYEG